ncbi:threonyl-tRNA synthetase editing domain-containing protein [Sulfobacillus sp. hq2]|uniref:threonyl-tRNA synthetase editing domain-containing protein n=1 Tax=Sulfobacillus TaxID=28033 RepID=UPI000CD014BD|nr:threonyl-tRNA synthetase editing domain-containing protein [Sulfobacillus sp. hq2]POB10906.1 hypothetical protein CO251_08895 [Sulfobacillus sp. hq2]
MVALYCDARRFAAHPVQSVIRNASLEAHDLVTRECTVFYLALEAGDTLKMVSQELTEAILRRNRRLPVVIHSFNHLSDQPLPVADAQRLYQDLPDALRNAGITEVDSTTFGWIYAIELHDVGKPGAKGRMVKRNSLGTA